MVIWYVDLHVAVEKSFSIASRVFVAFERVGTIYVLPAHGGHFMDKIVLHNEI
jgi:hypothetical protein